MKKELIIIALIISILLITINNIDAKQIPAKISPKVIDSLEKNDSVRIYVNINKSKYSSLSNTIDERKIKNKFEDKISIEVSKLDIENLINNPNIEKIELVPQYKTLLQDSVPLTNATISYPLQVSTINLTGTGQTICVIDSGINYSHPDLGGCFGNNNPSSNCKVLGGYDFVNDDSNPMDDNGHGTHVSGIIAANGTINGIAKNSKLIAIKACNSGGSCSGDDIQAGINWCSGNATTYNITVISISIGADCDDNPELCYSTYCNSDSLASAVNNAVGKNISVVIASGNDGNSTAVSSPACIQNATTVGSSTKSDGMSSFSNRWNNQSLLMLLAPGGDGSVSGSINSTAGPTSGSCAGQGQYMVCAGTSMSTPHVSGAIALIKQFLTLTGQNKTTEQIEIALNNTGKIITSGRNFSRINIYDAIISYDTINPTVSLTTANNIVTLNTSQTFSCNATDLELQNVTFYLWNSSSVYNQTTQQVSNSFNNYQINLSNLPASNYQWNCYYTDKNNNRAFATSNFSLTISDISVNLLSPLNNLFTNTNQTFSCNATSSFNLTNATLFVWNSTALINTTSINTTTLSNSTTFSYNFSYPDIYQWNCLFTNNVSSRNFASTNYTLTYDLTKPTLNVTSPINFSWYNQGKFNVTLNENGSCLYSLNQDLINKTLSSLNNRTFNATNNSLTSGNYNITYYCNDTAGNLNTSSLILFRIDTTAPNVSSNSPADGFSATGTTNILFEYNTTDNLNITQCSLLLNQVITASNSTIIIYENSSSNITNNISYSVSPGSYSWQINCTDEAGNIGNSSSRSLTINSPPSTSSGGGSSSGNGGSGAATFSTTEIQLEQGYTKELKPSDKISFEISNYNNSRQKHSLILNNVSSNSANITIKSDPINLILLINQSIKLNLTSSDYYNLLIKLNSIKNNKANLTIQEINEPIKEQNNTSNNEQLNDSENPIIKDIKNNKKIVIIFISTIVIIFVVYFLRKKHYHKR